MTVTMAFAFGSLSICGAVAAEGGLFHESVGNFGGKEHAVLNENMPLDSFAIVAHRGVPLTNMNLDVVNFTSKLNDAGCMIGSDGCYRGQDCFQCSNGCPMPVGTGCDCKPQCRFVGTEPPGCGAGADGCYKGSDCYHCPNFCETVGDGCSCPPQCQVGAQPTGCTKGIDGCHYGSGCYYCTNGCKVEPGNGCSCPIVCQRIENASCVLMGSCWKGTQCIHCSNGCERPDNGCWASCPAECENRAPASRAKGPFAENLRTVQV